MYRLFILRQEGIKVQCVHPLFQLVSFSRCSTLQYSFWDSLNCRKLEICVSVVRDLQKMMSTRCDVYKEIPRQSKALFRLRQFVYGTSARSHVTSRYRVNAMDRFVGFPSTNRILSFPNSVDKQINLDIAHARFKTRLFPPFVCSGTEMKAQPWRWRLLQCAAWPELSLASVDSNKPTNLVHLGLSPSANCTDRATQWTVIRRWIPNNGGMMIMKGNPTKLGEKFASM